MMNQKINFTNLVSLAIASPFPLFFPNYHLFWMCMHAQEGVRERLRETLQSVLVDEQQRRAEDRVEDREDESGTVKPFSTPTISKNTRYQYLTCISHVSHMYLTCISHVSHMYLTCISHVPHKYRTCTPLYPTYKNPPVGLKIEGKLWNNRTKVKMQVFLKPFVHCYTFTFLNQHQHFCKQHAHAHNKYNIPRQR